MSGARQRLWQGCADPDPLSKKPPKAGRGGLIWHQHPRPSLRGGTTSWRPAASQIGTVTEQQLILVRNILPADTAFDRAPSPNDSAGTITSSQSAPRAAAMVTSHIREN